MKAFEAVDTFLLLVIMLIYKKISYLKQNQDLCYRKVKGISIATCNGHNNICLFDFLFFGVDNQSRIDDFKQIKMKKGDKKVKVSK